MAGFILGAQAKVFRHENSGFHHRGCTDTAPEVIFPSLVPGFVIILVFVKCTL